MAVILTKVGVWHFFVVILTKVRTQTLVELVEGCDKSLATCATRFANMVNFRGEPYLPGIDLLTRYPGA
jgi:hypothetical protein